MTIEAKDGTAVNRKTVAEEYYLLAVNDKGGMPAMRGDESNAGLVAAGVVDLLSGGVIEWEKKKISVARELPGELRHLSSLYGYLREKPRTAEKLMSDYIASTGARLRELTAGIGEALEAAGAAKKEKGGFLGSRTVYIPEKSGRDEAADRLRSAVTGEEISPRDMALIIILKETKNLNPYFSESERAAVKERLKEMKSHPQNRQLADMINYVSDMTAVMAAIVVAGMV